MDVTAVAVWEAEYAAGRYAQEPSVGFVDDIVACVKDASLASGEGLYIGCGNGRNYLPLVDAGLDLVGLDISAVAIGQLAELAPWRRDRLVVGDLGALLAGRVYPLVVGIQVFQHGDRAETHAFVRDALSRVAPGGLFAVRVNAVGTDVEHRHEVTERDVDGSFSVRYEGGPKAGLTVHFWGAAELDRVITAEGLAPVMPLRADTTWRKPASRGLWSQWEGIYSRTA